MAAIARAETGHAELVSSEALLYEIERNPDPIRRNFALKMLAVAKRFVHVTSEIEQRAAQLARGGLTALDALHVACAEAAAADVFCTCDERILRKAQTLQNSSTKWLNPATLVAELHK